MTVSKSSWTTKSDPIEKYDTENARQYKDMGKDSDKFLRWAMILTVISIVLTILTIIVALLTIGRYEKKGDDDEDKPIVCIECFKLSHGFETRKRSDPLLRQLPRVYNVDKEEMCCAYNSHQMSTLLQAVMRVGASPNLPLDSFNAKNFTFSPVSAHKIIHYNNPEGISKDFGEMEIPPEPVFCHFDESNDHGLEHHRGVDVLEQGLRVKSGGLYYIYSSIQYRPQSIHPCSSFKFKTFTHDVLRSSSKYSWIRGETILKTTHTCCNECVNNEESRFTAGLFLLDPGDVIQVRIMGNRLIHPTPTTSFLGLAMLGTAKP